MSFFDFGRDLLVAAVPSGIVYALCARAGRRRHAAIRDDLRYLAELLTEHGHQAETKAAQYVTAQQATGRILARLESLLTERDDARAVDALLQPASSPSPHLPTGGGDVDATDLASDGLRPPDLEEEEATALATVTVDISELADVTLPSSARRVSDAPPLPAELSELPTKTFRAWLHEDAEGDPAERDISQITRPVRVGELFALAEVREREARKDGRRAP